MDGLICLSKRNYPRDLCSTSQLPRLEIQVSDKNIKTMNLGLIYEYHSIEMMMFLFFGSP